MFVIILTITTVCIACIATVTSLECESYFRGCCPGTLWNNKTKTCEACMDGYHGENCSISCPYPFFGKECQMICNCSEDLCDISKGCPIETTDTMQLSSKVKQEKSFEQTTFVAVGNSTIEATDGFTKQNDILRMLITVFGCIDLFLIFAYSVVYVKDRQKKDIQRIHTHEIVASTNTTYENIEIRFL